MLYKTEIYYNRKLIGINFSESFNPVQAINKAIISNKNRIKSNNFNVLVLNEKGDIWNYFVTYDSKLEIRCDMKTVVSIRDVSNILKSKNKMIIEVI